jgi:hypothetical protein
MIHKKEKASRSKAYLISLYPWQKKSFFITLQKSIICVCISSWSHEGRFEEKFLKRENLPLNDK